MNVNGPEGFFWMITRKEGDALKAPANEAGSWSLVGVSSSYCPSAIHNCSIQQWLLFVH